TQADVPAMLQTLLEDRFGLKVHKSEKEFSVFLLSRGKKPFSLTEVPPRDGGSGPTTTIGVNQARASSGGVALNLPRGALFVFADNKLEGKGMTMEMLANNLSNFLGSPTLDRTEVQGFYDLSFDLAPEDFGIMMARAAANRGVQMPPEVMTEIA